MMLFGNYMGQAWLLSRNGESLKVMNHPSIDFEFESIVELLQEHGNNHIKQVIDRYLSTGNPDLKSEIVEYYNDTWCKVRSWGTFGDEVTFRITSKSYNWYPTIVKFLEEHPQFSRSMITVESYKTKVKRIFWNKISYSEAIDRNNETILAAKLQNSLMVE